VTFSRQLAARCDDFSEPRLLADARHRLRLWALKRVKGFCGLKGWV
jgi:hypothetical protein